jgi:hypothetical protein
MRAVRSQQLPRRVQCSANSFLHFTNADDKNFEFDIVGSYQHNPLTFVSCSPPFDAEKRQVFQARRGADSVETQP